MANLRLLAAVAVIGWVGPPFAQAADLGTGFTYQGDLIDGGVPVNGSCDFKFTMWDAAVGGSQIGGDNVSSYVVIDGRFTADLDFGADSCNGQGRWLEIEVCCPSGCAPGYTPLSPRQELAPSPYALALPGLFTQQNSSSPNLIGGYSGNTVTAGVVGATVAGGGKNAQTNRVTDNYGTIGGGVGNQAGDPAGLPFDNPYATVGGGYANTASKGDATVGGGGNNTASGYDSTVGGGQANIASGSESTIGGGASNTASGNDSTVGGGASNTASSNDSTIGGGASNTASKADATVGGGSYNVASDYYSTVGGGKSNTASGSSSTVGGGNTNTASGIHTTVPGGYSNQAGGDYSFAAGRQAKVRDAAPPVATPTATRAPSSGPTRPTPISPPPGPTSF